MSKQTEPERIHTRIWLEEPEPDNPFATRAAFCRGYDVYGEMLGRVSWTQMILLLFLGEAPSAQHEVLFESLAVVLANPGPRDPSVHAAMCGGVGGSPAAANLMAALAVGAGQYTGAREVRTAMLGWETCGTDLDKWRAWRADIMQTEVAQIWSTPQHTPGFDPHGTSVPTTVRQALMHLGTLSPGPRLPWLAREHQSLGNALGGTLAMSGVAAATLADIGLSPDQGEMLYLLLRLPGAAAHALEQRGYGYKKFPFYPVELEDDPATKTKPGEGER